MGNGALVIPMRDVDALKAAGIGWPATYAAWQWLYRHREARGVAAAFSVVGRRILVDPVKFAELVRARKARTLARAFRMTPR